jgi:hypothetical protein
MIKGRILPRIDEIHIVAAAGDGRTEFFVAAGARDIVLANVRQRLPLGWMVTLWDRLSSQEAAALDLRSDEVRHLRQVLTTQTR